MCLSFLKHKHKFHTTNYFINNFERQTQQHSLFQLVIMAINKKKIQKETKNIHHHIIKIKCFERELTKKKHSRLCFSQKDNDNGIRTILFCHRHTISRNVHGKYIRLFLPKI